MCIFLITSNHSLLYRLFYSLLSLYVMLFNAHLFLSGHTPLLYTSFKSPFNSPFSSECPRSSVFYSLFSLTFWSHRFPRYSFMLFFFTFRSLPFILSSFDHFLPSYPLMVTVTYFLPFFNIISNSHFPFWSLLTSMSPCSPFHLLSTIYFFPHIILNFLFLIHII